LPGPKAQAAVAADARLISPSYTRSYPLVAKRGRGVRVEDVDGNEFLDFAAGIAVVSTGHCHPEVVAAIQKQAAELIHISGTDFYNEPLTDLADRLSGVAPMPGPHKFFYGNSGAEAIECALKLARYHTGRQQVISFLGAFHGRTMGALSLTGSKPQQKRRFSPLVPGVTHVRVIPMPIAAARGARRRKKPSAWAARATSKRSFSRPFCRPKKWPLSSSSRFRARAATWWRRTISCANCAPSAIATAFCWWWTRCSAARAARASGGPSSTPAWSRIWSAWPRASPAACRWASA
jgi:hypothetical protein